MAEIEPEGIIKHVEGLSKAIDLQMAKFVKEMDDALNKKPRSISDIEEHIEIKARVETDMKILITFQTGLLAAIGRSGTNFILPSGFKMKLTTEGEPVEQ